MHLPNFEQTRILVVGDIMLDRYWNGRTSRISPEAPVPVVAIANTEDRLGGAANVTKNLAVLGCKAKLCGLIGDDEAGKAVRTLLAEAGIDDQTISGDSPTITKMRVISHQQQLLRLDIEEKISNGSNRALEKTFEDNLSSTDVVVLSDYAKGTLTSPQVLIQSAKQAGIPVLIDPKGNDFERYRGAFLLTPNRSEIEAIVGNSDSLDELFTKAENLRESLELTALLITLSEHGMVLLQEGNSPLHIATVAREVFDVTGAGDTVIATLAATIAAKLPLEEGVRLANLAAGIAVGKLGTAHVSPQEIEKAIVEQHNTMPPGIVSESELIKYISHCQKQGEKVVMTNGCFDILHAGHVHYLEQAAALGDRLIVAVNSDASVKQLKGDSRPINPLQQRMTVLAALRSVDWVVPFSEETPARLIGEILPNVLVKGGDYQPEEIAGYKEVTDKGGQVIVLDFVDGCSTTEIINAVLNQNKP